jgi:intracellular sulfur oxidation DsrE/DsrF family protein
MVDNGWRHSFRHSEVDMQRLSAPRPSARRSFLSRLGAGLAAFGTGWGVATSTSASASSVQTPSPSGWQPARQAEDDWLDKIPGNHRTILDAVSAQGVGDALHFASNIYETSASGYRLRNTDVAVVICLRHGATPFGFNDAMWAKYGSLISQRAKFSDPKSHGPAVVNVFNSTEYRGLLSNGAATFDALIAQGIHFAVCDHSTHGYAAGLAQKNGGSAETTYKELTSNLIGNSHMVPSGIVAVGHAQERGYAYAYCG